MALSNSKQWKHLSTVKWVIQLVYAVRILHTPYTNDFEHMGLKSMGPLIQILFNCKYHGIITHGWLNLQIATVDMERQIQRADCKVTHDFLAAERVGTSSPSAVLGSTELLYACCALWRSLSHVWLFAIPWTVACQAPLSMEFSRQEYWSGVPFPLPGDLPNPGIELRSPALQADYLPFEPACLLDLH